MIKLKIQILLIFTALTITSCCDDISDTSTQKYTISFQEEDYISKHSTTRAIIRNSVFYTPDNLWLFLFDARNNIIGNPSFYNSTENIEIKAPSNLYKIVAVANTYSSNISWNISNLQELMSRYKNVQVESDYHNPGKDELMSAVTILSEHDKATQNISIILKRNIAKIDFELASLVDGLEPIDIELCNVSMELAYVTNGRENGPLTLRIINRHPIRSYSNREKLTFYVPENIQESNRQEYALNRNLDAPRHAMYFIVNLRRGDEKYQLRVYPGENNTNNFSVIANHYYKERITISTLSGIDEDTRIKRITD